MPNLNTEEIKKLKRGEIAGIVALAVCGAACIALIAIFAVAIVLDDTALRFCALAVCIVIGVFSVIAAVCNLKYGKKLDRITKNYVRDVFVENASLLHPERDSLNYVISNEGWTFSVRTNNFKEQITFDFSAFNKLSSVRRGSVATAIIDRLGATYCRLAERGGKYKTVSFCIERDGKLGKTIFIIENGTPDKRAYKNYLKQK